MVIKCYYYEMNCKDTFNSLPKLSIALMKATALDLIIKKVNFKRFLVISSREVVYISIIPSCFFVLSKRIHRPRNGFRLF